MKFHLNFNSDVGYERVTGVCQLTGTPLPEPPTLCPEGFNYTKTKGYINYPIVSHSLGIEKKPETHAQEVWTTRQMDLIHVQKILKRKEDILGLLLLSLC